MNENKTNINWYPGHMAKTKRLISENLNLIDVVYEVLDARIPVSSKITDIDNFIKNKKKIPASLKDEDLENIHKNHLLSVFINPHLLPLSSVAIQ